VALDIIVVNYNSGQYLLSCLESLYQQDLNHDFRITVFDNGSSDDSVRPAQKEFPRTAFLKSPVNLGFARAVNRVLARTDAPYAMLVNPDVLALPGAIDRMRDFMERHPACGVLGAEILSAEGLTQPTCRRFPTYYNVIFGRRSIFRRIFPNNPGTRRYLYLDQDRSRPHQVDFLEGSMILIRRRALTDTGLLDEDFFLYMEDADLCLRMAQRGWETWWLPRAYAIHFRGENFRSDNIRPMRHHSQGIYKFFLKHRRPGLLSRTLLKFLLSLRLGYVLSTEFAKKGIA
jgi:N-acetylglucosaminyl-diphospho-decaprenol L-rhamnosyltransferase